MTNIESAKAALGNIDLLKCGEIRSLLISVVDDTVNIECSMYDCDGQLLGNLRFEECWQVNVLIPGNTIETAELQLAIVTDAVGRSIGYRFCDEVTGRINWCCTRFARLA
jgi:hypothetical protein